MVLALSFALAGSVTGALRLSKTPAQHPVRDAGLGIQPGKIKHVWPIILENKSYDATFTGLNKNTYLWRTLPAQGVLLKNYYGTGHGSFDSYLTLVSGQATQPDSQVDCPYYDRLGAGLPTLQRVLRRDVAARPRDRRRERPAALPQDLAVGE